MYAPLTALAFLAALWLVNLVIADMLNLGLGKAIAALKGRSVRATAPSYRPIAVRVSQRARAPRALRLQPQLRAAA